MTDSNDGAQPAASPEPDRENSEITPPPAPGPVAQVGISILFLFFGTAYWGFTAGLGWGLGVAVARRFELEAEAALGGIGVWLTVVSLMLPARHERKAEAFRILSAGFGGAAFGAVTLSVLVPGKYSPWIGGAAGYFFGMMSAVMKHSLVPVKLPAAGAIALVGSATLAGIGAAMGGLAGWSIAGALALLLLPVLCVAFRAVPLQEIGASGEILREVPASEWMKGTLRTALNPAALGSAWLWKGALAGGLGFLWSDWALESAANPQAVTGPFLVCGVLAVAAVLGTIFRQTKDPAETS